MRCAMRLAEDGASADGLTHECVGLRRPTNRQGKPGVAMGAATGAATTGAAIGSAVGTVVAGAAAVGGPGGDAQGTAAVAEAPKAVCERSADAWLGALMSTSISISA